MSWYFTLAKAKEPARVLYHIIFQTIEKGVPKQVPDGNQNE